MDFGLLHPGEMGAAVGRALTSAGHRVYWVADGRSGETVARASAARLEPCASLSEMTAQCEVVLSICPPHAAVDVARQVAEVMPSFRGIYVDANAVSPLTAADVSAIVIGGGARYVDGGIIGTPPPRNGTRLYLAGQDAPAIVEACRNVELEMITLDGSETAASALKMAYAAWTKGTSAFLLAIRSMANYYGVGDALVGEWEQSQPDLLAKSEQAARSAMAKGWRWTGEMREIATALSVAGLPEGFGAAAASVYERTLRRDLSGVAGDDLSTVLDDLGHAAAEG